MIRSSWRRWRSSTREAAPVRRSRSRSRPRRSLLRPSRSKETSAVPRPPAPRRPSVEGLAHPQSPGPHEVYKYAQRAAPPTKGPATRAHRGDPGARARRRHRRVPERRARHRARRAHAEGSARRGPSHRALLRHHAAPHDARHGAARSPTARSTPSKTGCSPRCAWASISCSTCGCRSTPPSVTPSTRSRPSGSSAPRASSTPSSAGPELPELPKSRRRRDRPAWSTRRATRLAGQAWLRQFGPERARRCSPPTTTRRPWSFARTPRG